MTVLKEVAAELIGMFVAEKQLTMAILGVVIVAGWLANFTDLDPLVGGIALLLGCLVLLVESVFRGARTRGL